MPQLETQLASQNPWWVDPAATDQDPHLRQYRAGGLDWSPPVLDTLMLRFGDTDTLRGPRQAGKTTTVKRLIERLVRRGESRVLYFTLDLMSNFRDLPDVISTAKRMHAEPHGPWYIFLDEITSVPEWQRGIKYAWDQGLTRDDYLLLTGSSAHDLRRGAEQLPGRRGNGLDYLQLPMSFRDFLQTAIGLELTPETLMAEECRTPDGRRILARLNLRSAELDEPWNAYVKTGGFPAAVRDFVASGRPEVTPGTIKAIWNVIKGDIVGSRRDPIAALKFLEHAAVSLGNPVKWTGAARAMNVADVTARQYSEYLSESFALLTVFFWDLGGKTLSPGKQRKVYFMDPLLGLIPNHVVQGSRMPPDAGVIENLVATGLFRSAAQSLIQADPVPGSIAYWRSTSNREIDFVVPTQSGGPRFPIEVKGDSDSGIGYARSAIRKSFGSGVVLARTTFDWAEDVPVVPVHVFLAALREQPNRALTV